MTDKMIKLLEAASGQVGVAEGRMINERMQAQRNGWVKFSGIPQNSTIGRYSITEEGRKVLGA